jgi:hypothetical protein
MTARLRDICVYLPDRAGALAEFGEALGAAEVSLEGGGVFTHVGVGVAHFLVDDADTASSALHVAGLPVVAVRDVVMLRLDQETPGQLGTLARLMADADVNIDVQYSDHDKNLVLVVHDDHLAAARTVAERWLAIRP